jgi:uncharacterized ubiquitin-like protein YukD
MELDITIQDVGGANAVDFTVPSDVPAKNIVAKLLSAMNLPTHDPSGTPMSYMLHHVQTQRQINQDATLLSSDVKDGDSLRLVPQIIAGGASY